MTSVKDQLGTVDAYNHYAVGWAWAMDTPFQWTKQVASHWGGTRNGTIVHWPHGFTARGEVRSQFHHVIDIAPTVLDAAGLPHPAVVNGVEQHPIEGVSMGRPALLGGRSRCRHDWQQVVPQAALRCVDWLRLLGTESIRIRAPGFGIC